MNPVKANRRFDDPAPLHILLARLAYFILLAAVTGAGLWLLVVVVLSLSLK